MFLRLAAIAVTTFSRIRVTADHTGLNVLMPGRALPEGYDPEAHRVGGTVFARTRPIGIPEDEGTVRSSKGSER